MELQYFKITDFDCQETGENNMQEEFLLKLDALRHICKFPFNITSGYRSPKHSIESKKSKPGTHSEGIAADILVTSSAQKYEIVKQAMLLGFNGIGVAKTFIHVDIRKHSTMWSY